MRVTLCDWREKDKPCGERADLLVTFTDADGKRWEIDVCSQLHGKMLVANAREAESPGPRAQVTHLPKVTATGTRKPRERLIDPEDIGDCKAWLMDQGKIKSLKGAVSLANQELWLSEGSPRPTASDGTFVKSA